jgi:hypothetical protein
LGGFIYSSMKEFWNLWSIKQRGAYRILCLGESTTEWKYPFFLAEALNQRNTGVCFSVIDKGKSGTNSPAILSRVESYSNEHQPEV